MHRFLLYFQVSRLGKVSVPARIFPPENSPGALLILISLLPDPCAKVCQAGGTASSFLEKVRNPYDHKETGLLAQTTVLWEFLQISLRKVIVIHRVNHQECACEFVCATGLW